MGIKPWRGLPGSALTVFKSKCHFLAYKAVFRWPHEIHRDLSTRTTFRIGDLPQGTLHGRPSVHYEAENNALTSYPPVLRQARSNMQKFSDCVLLTRVGNFYELYFEHAEEYGPLLNLKVGIRRTSAGQVPMAGFPFFQLERFTKTLVQDLGKSVAISEEFSLHPTKDSKSEGLLFDRRVARVITPGTLIDERFMDPQVNNFLLAIHVNNPSQVGHSSRNVQQTYDLGKFKCSETLLGLAWLDLSTGEFFTQVTDIEELPSSLARIAPREIVLSQKLSSHIGNILQQGSTNDTVISWQSEDYEAQVEGSFSESHSAFKIFSELTAVETTASAILLKYVRDKLQGLDIMLPKPVRLRADENMSIDKNTMRGLEILQSCRDSYVGAKGSLLHTIRRTVTSGGARLLRLRLASPSASVIEIEERLDLVEIFVKQPTLLYQVRTLLKRTSDLQRLVQKFALGRGDADDLMDLKKTIRSQEAVIKLLRSIEGDLCLTEPPLPKSSIALERILNKFVTENSLRLVEDIEQAIDQEKILSQYRSEYLGSTDAAASADCSSQQERLSDRSESALQVVSSKASTQSSSLGNPAGCKPFIMKKEASKILCQLHGKFSSLISERISLQNSLRNSLGAPSLTLRWTSAHAHFCHIKGAKDLRKTLYKVPSTDSLGASKSTRSFYHEDWSTLGAKIEAVRESILYEEGRVFRTLRESVIRNQMGLRKNASLMDELDVGCSSATLAIEQRLVRPILCDEEYHHIIAGRHPSVKRGLEERGLSFVANDCSVGDKSRIWLITGPNMAGKSTFLRQNALITIMAQVGSYVPAEYAKIGIVDQMFSRIGAADNLYDGQSTFMVEMQETASILRSATSKSFVIMDEIGRGTTPGDGLAVSFAALHHLYNNNRCRTLFATHFHDLANMAYDWESLELFHNDIREDENESFHFIHKLRPGVNRQSHALKIAKLAGVPQAALDVAAGVLRNDASLRI